MVVAIVVYVCVIGTVVPAGVIIGTKPIVVVIGVVGLGVVEASKNIPIEFTDVGISQNYV